MTLEERERILELCRRLRDERDQKKVLVLAEELNRFLDSAMKPVQSVRLQSKAKAA